MTARQSATRSTGKKVRPVFKELLGQVPPAEGGHIPSSKPDGIRDQIATRAYALYEERGYRQGCELQDWLDAEREILNGQTHF